MITTRANCANCASYVAPKQLLSQYFFNAIVPAAGAGKFLYRLVMRGLRFADFFEAAFSALYKPVRISLLE